MNLIKKQFYLSSFFIVVSTISLLAQSNLPGCSRTYTDNVDFDEGLLLSVNYNVPGTLRLDQPGQPLPFVYIPCSARGTVVRINAETGEITGEFASAPDGRGKDPSRTTVDEFGNVWVSNRAENGIINGVAKGSVIRIGIVIGGTRANADGTPNPTGQYLKPPFLYNTCIDRNGDGLIKTSRGLGNILPWTNAGGVDTDGGVETAEDEAITVYTRVFATGARTVAVDANGDIWVGGSSNRFHEKLNGTTGEPISGTVFNTGTGGYGGLIDGNGFLWSAGAPGNPILKYNTVTGASTNISGNGNYGLGIDPNTGEIWSTDLEGNRVVKMTPSGAIIGSYPHGNFYAQGVGVDAFGNVWVAHSLIGPSTTIGHLRTDGTYVGNVQLGPQGSGPIGIGIDNNGKIWTASINGNTAQRIDPNAGPIGGGGFPIGVVDLTVNLGAGAGPYTYSDMTGFVAINATVPSGSWTVVRDGQVAGRKWGKITWTADTPPQTGIRVEARASDNLLNLALTPFVEVQNGVEFCCAGVTGRYVEIRTNLFRGISVNTTPVLYDLTIECCDIYPNTPPQIISSNGCGTNNILLIPAGQTSSFTLTAADIDMNQGVTINAIGLPTGATMTPNIPVVGNPVSSTFSWTPTTNQLGEYTVRFTANDIYCYQAICEKKIQVVPCPQISGVVTNPTCPNSNTGSIVTSVLGGTPPYTYLWSNGKTTKNLINITAGSYSVTVTCTNGFTGTKQFTLTNPPLLLASLNCPVACFNQCNGQATVTVSGGTPGYTYQWSGPNGYTAGNVSTISNLCPGSYRVTVTDSKGCKRIVSGSVTQNPQIVINQTINEILCTGQCNGKINLSISGGCSPYLYLWSNGSTKNQLANLCAGTYTVTVTDAKGCKSTKSFSLVNPAQLLVNITATPILCNGGNSSVSAVVSGGTAGYLYSWSTGATTSSINVAAVPVSVTITDSKGCTKTAQQTILQPEVLKAESSLMDPLCNNAYGICNGKINVVTDGGTTPYHIVWNDGYNEEFTRTELCGGAYAYTVTDASGCSITGLSTLTDPDPITGIDEAKQCSEYLWVDGVTYTNSGTYTTTLLSYTGCDSLVTLYLTINQPSATTITDTITQGETYDFNGQNLTTAGMYTATLQNAAGCDSLVTLTLSVEQGFDCSISSTNDIICQGESVTLTSAASGVLPSVNYSLDFPNTAQYSGNAQAIGSTNKDGFNLTGDFTIEFWIKAEGSFYWHLMGKNTFGNNSQGWLLKKPSNNLMMAWTYVPDEFDFHPFSLGQWEHIAICFDDDANVFRYFKNGNLVSTEFRDINVNVSPYDLVIGHELGTGNWFDGKLDNLRISNVSRYSGSFNPSQTFVNDASVIAMYDFNEGSGNVAQDLSGNGRVLDLFNTNFSSDVPGGSSINQSAILWSNGSQDQTIIVSPTETTTYSVTVTQGNQTCTSEVTITVNQPSDTTITATINQGEIYSFNGQDLTTAGTYTATLQNAAGCDSLVTFNLEVNQNPINCQAIATNNAICQGESSDLAVVISGTSGSISNQQGFFEDFNDCNLDNFTFSGGSISITQDAFEGSCAVGMTHFAGESPNNFYPSGLNFHYGTYSVMANATAFISDNLMYLFQGDDLEGGLRVFSLPNNTDNPGFYVQGLGIDYYSGLVNVSSGQWYEMKVEIFPSIINVFINNELKFSTSQFEVPSPGRFKLGVAFSGIYDNMRFVPFGNSSSVLWSTGDTTPSISVSPTETTTYSVTVNQGGQTCTSEVTITVNQPTAETVNATITEGETYSFNGQNLTTAGTYTATLQNAAGCDSVVTLNLQVQPDNNSNCQITASDTEICPGQTVQLDIEIPCNSTGQNVPTWELLIPGSSIPSNGFNVRPFTYDRVNRVLYSAFSDGSLNRLQKFDLVNNTVTQLPASGWFGRLDECTYDHENNRLIACRSGRDNIYAIPVTGGSWSIIGNGTFDNESYGGMFFWNSKTHRTAFFGGYGFFQVKNWIWENNGSGWVNTRANLSNCQPAKRGGGSLQAANLNYSKYYLFSGQGSCDGNQFASSCSLGSPWQTDVGQYCWLRDLWELDINTYQFTNILPVNNQSIVREGSFTFDYENNIFYILGGFIPTGTYGFYLPSTMDVYKLKKGVDQSFSQIQVNGNPPPPNGYGYSIYDDIGNRIIYARPDGIWALNLGENCNVGFEWSNGNSTQSISVSPQETTTYSVNVNYGNQTCTSFITISVGSEYCNAGTRGDEGARFSDVYLYPNPANQILNLELNVSLETQTNIRITDLLGRVALEQTEDLIAGSNTITYNISDFAKGVYLIQVSNGNEQKVFKLVKE